MDDLFPKMMNIAQMGGRKGLIDTPAEIYDVELLLNEAYSGLNGAGDEASIFQREAVLQALEELNSSPADTRFHVNWGRFKEFPVCRNESQDCYKLLIPVPSDSYDIFPIYSGATFMNFVDYVAISNESWEKIVEPLVAEIDSSENERKYLAMVVDNFGNTVTPSDIGWWFGNYIPTRGQQDCTEELASVLSLVWQLQMEDHLKFHELDLDHPIDGVPIFHYTAVISELGGEYFVVDPWWGRTNITGLIPWKDHYRKKFKEQYEPKN